VLNAGGRFVPCSAGGGNWLGPVARIIGGRCVFFFGGRRMMPFLQRTGAADLVTMRDLIERGAARPVVERVWSFPEAGTALRHVGRGHSRGLNVVRIAG
jgi:NADPH:quinone reductase-like Zn-dependent oxidoreductase